MKTQNIILLKCKCGWSDFVPRDTPETEFICPLCGAVVAVPGRTPPEDVEPPKKSRRGILLAAGAAGAAAAVVALVLLLFAGGGEEEKKVRIAPRPRKTAPPPPRAAETPEPEKQFEGVRMIVEEPSAPSPAAPPPEPPPAPAPSRPRAFPAGEALGLKKEIDRNVALANMAGIRFEIFRQREAAADLKRMREKMAEGERLIDGDLRRLLEEGDRHVIAPHMRPGDRLVSFAGRDLTKMSPKEAADFLEGWLKDKFRAGVMEPCVIRRGGAEEKFVVFFPERDKELLALAGIEEAPAPLPVTDGNIDLPEALVREIAGRWAALPDGYLRAIPDLERRRMEALLKQRRVSVEDLDFLDRRISREALPAFERENARFRDRAAELEPLMREPPAIDMVHFKNGGKMEGAVVGEEGGRVKIKSPLGTVTRDKNEILRTERIVTGEEFPGLLDAAGVKTGELAMLVGWCKGRKLHLQKEYLCNLILTLDPLNAQARRELSLPAAPGTGAAAEEKK